MMIDKSTNGILSTILIALVSLSIISIALQQVFALQQFSVTVGNNNGGNQQMMSIQKASASFFVGSKYNTTGNKYYVFIINPLTNATTYSFLGYRGDSGASAVNSLPVTQLGCDNSYCFITGANGTAPAKAQTQVWSISSTGTLSFYKYHNWTFSNVASTMDVGHGDGFFYFYSIDSTLVDQCDADFVCNTLGATGDACGAGATSIRGIELNPGTHRLGVYCHAGATSFVVLYNTVSLSKVCQTANLGSANPNGGITFDNNRGTFFVPASSSTVKEISTTCTVPNTITLTASSTITSLESSSGLHELYIQQANNLVQVYSDSNLAFKYSFANTDSSSNTVLQHNVISSNNIFVGRTSTVAQFSFLTGSQSSPSGGNTGTASLCIDTNHDGVTNVCFTDSDGDGIPDSSPLALVTASQPLTSVGFNLLCQINVSENFCGNTNSQTNGVGYLYWFILFLLMGSMAYLVFGEKGKGKALGDLNIMIIIITMIASAFICYAFEWIDFTLPVITIVVICAFGAKQLYGFIGGRSSGDD